MDTLGHKNLLFVLLANTGVLSSEVDKDACVRNWDIIIVLYNNGALIEVPVNNNQASTWSSHYTRLETDLEPARVL